MKTLDEVIKAVEYCNQDSAVDCTKCLYEGINCQISDMLADALEYLKAYREDKDELDRTRLAYLDVLTDYVALKNYWAEQQENPPLTWDELRQMEGKPVWIDSVPLVRRWVVIKKFHSIGGNHNLFDMEVEDGAHFLRKSMGRDTTEAWWQAYRKERS